MFDNDIKYMKQSVLPEIPQQQIPGMNLMISKSLNNRSFHDISSNRQVQNPYQHLIRPLNNASQIQHANHRNLSKIEQKMHENLIKQKDQSYYKKIMFLMHEQIQICLKFYSQKFNQQLKMQATEIIKLKQMLQHNNRQLNEKNNIIEGLKIKLKEIMNGSPSSSKKKISITSRGASKSPSKNQNSQNSNKIQQIEQKLTSLRSHEHKILELQQKFAKKLNKIQISTISLLGNKLNKGKIRLNSFIEKGAIKIKEIQYYLQNINVQQNQQKNQASKIQIQCLKTQLQQIKRNCKAFNEKEFKYENYQIDYLSNQIAQINTKICVLEHKKSQLQYSNKYLQNGSILKYSSQQNLQPNTNNYGINPQQFLTPQQTFEKSVSKFTSPTTTRQIKEEVSLAHHSKNTQNNKNKPSLRQDKLNLNSNSNNISSERASQNKIAQNKNDLSYSYSISQLEKQEVENFYKSSRNFVNQSKNVVNTSTINNENWQRQFSQSDSVEDYTDEEYEIQNQKYEENRIRLLEVLKNKNMQLPIDVEIDQTGYLKSVRDGMYLVDIEGNGFELQQCQIQQLSKQGVINVI